MPDPALTRLVDRYHDRVYAHGLRVCRDPADAEDVVQDAYVKLAGREDVQRGPTVLGWLLTVVRHACLRLLARVGRTVGLEVDAVPSADPSPERWVAVAGIRRTIDGLPGPAREVLVLRDLEGWSAEEVAAALDLTTPAVKSRLQRARQALRDRLDPP